MNNEQALSLVNALWQAGRPREDIANIINELPLNGSQEAALERLHQLGEQRPRELPYCLDDLGQMCWVKRASDGSKSLVPLCNFRAWIESDIVKDDGLTTRRFFRISGKLADGEDLPPCDVPVSGLQSLNWVIENWGSRAVIGAGQSYRDRLREALQHLSTNVRRERVYTHIGWREIAGRHVYLTSGGATAGDCDTTVELEGRLSHYCLPHTIADTEAVEAIRKSFDFLHVAPISVSLPLFSIVYAAPLLEFIPEVSPFTLWLVGPSGSFKSVLSALALSHYGQFTHKSLPSSWTSTLNQLERLAFLVKDCVFVVDDWAPGQDAVAARQLETKAEALIRAFGNTQAKGRMTADLTSRPSFYPRGLLLTSGEQLPSGFSANSRIVPLPVDGRHIDKKVLTGVQEAALQYPKAMTAYLLWLSTRYDTLAAQLPGQWREWRKRAEYGGHPRAAEAFALLFTGLHMVTQCAVEKGAMTSESADSLRTEAWRIFAELSEEQHDTVSEQQPGERFIQALRGLIATGRAKIENKDDLEPPSPPPGVEVIGWTDTEGKERLLSPGKCIEVVKRHLAHTGSPLTLKDRAIADDLMRLGYIKPKEIKGKRPQPTHVRHVNGRNVRVWLTTAEALEDSEQPDPSI